MIPTDGSPHIVGDGLWLQDDRSSPPALHHSLILSDAQARKMAIPRCAVLARDGACEDGAIENRTFAPQTGELLAAPKQPCMCMRRREVAGYPPTEIDGERFEACMGGGEELLMAMVGGQLLFQGWDWNGACMGGLSVYDALDSRHELIDDAPELSSDGMRSIGCNLDMGPAFVERGWPIDYGSLGHDCEDYFESQSFMLRRGDLWAVRDDIAFAHGFRRYLKRPARPDSCPSVNDPCGDPQPFRGKAKLDRKRREFWIATDGSAALTAEGTAYALWLADVDAPIEFELPSAHATRELIGVRTHHDIGLLRALMTKQASLGVERSERAPTTVALEDCIAAIGPANSSSSARELGNTCFMYIGIEQWMDAEDACLRGLAIADEPNTRGAILFNLGLIAEAEGAREQAALYYRESLAVRPGNRAVERKLARLKLP